MKESGFLILGHPRSGTNLLTALLRETGVLNVQVEPFSMHTAFSRDYDLIADSPTRRLLQDAECPFTKSLISYLSHKSNGIKETTLFEHLDILGSALGIKKIVYIQRPYKDVIASYYHYGLFERWGLTDTKAFRSWATQYNLGATSIPEEFVRWTYKAKQGYWNEHKGGYQHIEIDYDTLVSRPKSTLADILRFLDCNPNHATAGVNRVKIRHTTLGAKSYPYAVF